MVVVVFGYVEAILGCRIGCLCWILFPSRHGLCIGIGDLVVGVCLVVVVFPSVVFVGIGVPVIDISLVVVGIDVLVIGIGLVVVGIGVLVIGIGLVVVVFLCTGFVFGSWVSPVCLVVLMVDIVVVRSTLLAVGFPYCFRGRWCRCGIVCFVVPSVVVWLVFRILVPVFWTCWLLWCLLQFGVCCWVCIGLFWWKCVVLSLTNLSKSFSPGRLSDFSNCELFCCCIWVFL